MRAFFDTSVLIAALRDDHDHHGPSFERVKHANKTNSTCGIHTFAEVYATLTGLPRRPRPQPQQVFLVIEGLRERLTPIVLNTEEYLDTLRKTADAGLTSRMIYDALLLACAAKSGAEVIYTWNLKNFRAIAPELADRIQTP